MDDHTPRSDQTAPRSFRWKLPVAVAGSVVAGTVLLGGGVALASGNDSGASNGSTTAPAGAAGNQDGGGAATGSTDSSTEGTQPPGDGGPAAGKAPAGGPAAGKAPAGGPAVGRAPAGGPAAGGPPAPGDAPVPPPASRPGDPAAGDRTVGTVTSVSDSALTVTDDQGKTHDFTLSDDTRIESGPGKDDVTLDTGNRVEVRGTDGAATTVHLVFAHVNGVVVAVDGDVATVVTTEGLHLQVDVSALGSAPAVGDDVHLQGTVGDDGETVLATGSAAGPR